MPPADEEDDADTVRDLDLKNMVSARWTPLEKEIAQAANIPPPPAPLDNWARRDKKSTFAGPLISIGSVGHPTSCAGACESTAKGQACSLGANCTRCHACVRPSEGAETTKGFIDSVGTRGHPRSCGEACKYVKRKGGCRDGANCLQCHRCFWHRQIGLEEVSTARKSENDDHMPPALAAATAATSQPLKVTVQANMSTLQSAQVLDCLPSLGSLGHPVSCGLACKYSRKPKGCKDGRLCTRCHLCHWFRSDKKDDVPQSHSAKDILNPGRCTTSSLVPVDPVSLDTPYITLQHLSL